MTNSKSENDFDCEEIDESVYSYQDDQQRIKEHLTSRRITQADIDFLKLKKSSKINEKQRWTEEIFIWLIQCEVLWSYEILEYFNKQDIHIHINQLPWTPAHLRLQNYAHIYNTRGKSILRMYIGGNTAAADAAWYTTEDYYFPDFDIYNDVTIKYLDGTCELWNYPEEQFPPVYAHSTIYDKNTHKTYITGGLGSGDRQRQNVTEIYVLDLETKDIQKIEALGESPPCLHDHNTKIWNHDLIEIKGGYILHKGIAIKNMYVWYFNLKTQTWLKQESEQYQQWVITPEIGRYLSFYDYRVLIKYEKEDPQSLAGYLENLFNNNICVKDYNLYSRLYCPVDEMYYSKT
ncbi:hypothetical protein, partial [Acinetobacter sp. CFCC 10889]|uniref:hypothetical protein n=1 Tax=Acinetobacter sp. CFCC 10889 TaxID=1775557 RepID=UPI001BC87578